VYGFIAIVFAVGLISFARKDMITKPKNADAMEIREISYHRKFVPFMTLVGVYFLYFKILAPFVIMFLDPYNLIISITVAIVLTVLISILLILAMILTMDPIIVEISPLGEFNLHYKGKHILLLRRT
jgi:uncharacterized membrane protein